MGRPIYIERVRAAVAAADANRLDILLEGAAGACREIRDEFTEPLRKALRSADGAMLNCAIKHWQAVGFPPAEARDLLLGILRRPAKGAWKGVVEQLLAMDPGNREKVVDTLCGVILGKNDTLSQEAALLVADVVAQGNDPAQRKRAAAAAVPVLQQMILFETRIKEARNALVELQGIPREP